MIDIDVGAVLAERLRQVRSKRQLTIQEMSDMVGIPKSSLESYMRTKEPKKPGLEALVAISTGMGVSTDWLVGRSETADFDATTKRQFAVAVYDVTQRALRSLRRRLDDRTEGQLGDDDTDTQTYQDIACVALLNFARSTNLFQNADDEFVELDAALLEAQSDREVKDNSN